MQDIEPYVFVQKLTTMMDNSFIYTNKTIINK